MPQKIRIKTEEEPNEIAFNELHEKIDELIKKYKLTKQTIRNWVLKSKYPKIKINNQKYISKIEEYLNEGMDMDSISKKMKMDKKRIYSIIHSYRLKKSPKFTREKTKAIIEDLKTEKKYTELGKKYQTLPSRIFWIDKNQEKILDRYEKEDQMIKTVLEELNNGKSAKYICIENGWNYAHYIQFIKYKFKYNQENKLILKKEIK